jgi:hypothetical protein
LVIVFDDKVKLQVIRAEGSCFLLIDAFMEADEGSDPFFKGKAPILLDTEIPALVFAYRLDLFEDLIPEIIDGKSRPSLSLHPCTRTALLISILEVAW